MSVYSTAVDAQDADPAFAHAAAIVGEAETQFVFAGCELVRPFPAVHVHHHKVVAEHRLTVVHPE